MVGSPSGGHEPIPRTTLRRPELVTGSHDDLVSAGMLGERHGVPPGAAFEMLRRYARNNNRMLRDVCRRVVDGELDL